MDHSSTGGEIGTTKLKPVERLWVSGKHEALTSISRVVHTSAVVEINFYEKGNYIPVIRKHYMGMT